MLYRIKFPTLNGAEMRGRWLRRSPLHYQSYHTDIAVFFLPVMHLLPRFYPHAGRRAPPHP